MRYFEHHIASPTAMTDPGNAYLRVENLINKLQSFTFDLRRLGKASIVATATVKTVALNVKIPAR